MIVKIDRSFEKDVSKISNAKTKVLIVETIEAIQQTETLTAIKNLKKLTGYKYLYRIKLGDYRIGLRFTENQELIFIRFLHRGEIYKKWP